MRFRSTLAGSLLVVAGLAVAPAFAGTPVPTIWTYPGTAPCDTTLQACIDAAGAGDTIRIVSDIPDLGVVTHVTKSLTLEGDPATTRAASA